MDIKRSVAIIDDEAHLRESVAQYLQLYGFDTATYDAAEPALKQISPDFAGIVVTDIRMPGMDGMALLRKMQSVDPGLPVILMTGHGDVPMAVEAMRIGAFDFVEKPFEPERLRDLCQRATEIRARTLETRALRRELSDGTVLMRRLMGNSPSVAKMRETILDVAQADGHILILGETGTGKSLVARAIHACGPRASKPFVTLNCASVQAGQVEAMLFGAEDWPEKPLIDQAEGGTLCLEDVEDLPPGAQARLLETINAAEPTGGAARPLNMRIVAVSSRLGNSPPPAEVMRDDLYFRLAGLIVEVPPLRARGEDILALFSHFTIQFAEEYGCEPPTLNAGDAANLVQAPWPGNIRQLINLAERAVLQARRGETNISALLIDDGFDGPVMAVDAEKPLKEHVDAFEKMLIDHALRRNQGSVAAVMTELALPRRTLNEKMAKYGLSRQDYL
ncbi:MAG TPA: sigma-54 dependent transcriptional regulator [Amaricoccus sp.]|uniref:sigma-54-dependent transcriptional regulator n=1 Tax=Amaricoccus sp. TaxID=1872485 RepID=UPI002C3DC086|nr:sigma-54 dependent transcriptional regulator [Amaricoccus sp.]HMQ94331.1 sigma-54 dependent transcriptional regulator [Amaricoccus sp.]HMR52919.1 sigma-54 dependent transcriptional regulator [Amaricoccus sp.]HMR60840.1 sigma-54 dependent transcriptional regulator [Amaricoccus sp.]HMT99814.1 sigma-54 dependent transcriptional regulator [Amaricoccus sp.]